MPIEEGTPINKALLDQKANRLTESVTVYVATTGSDTDGQGTSASPYATIQKAIDSLPKYLDSRHAQIDIANGTYDERVTVDGFSGGRLTIGVTGRTVTVRGISIMSSAAVRICISNITYSASYAGTLLYADYGSNVTIINPITIRGGGTGAGIAASRGSLITSIGSTVALLSVGGACVLATGGSLIAMGTVEGNSNTSSGLRAEQGSTICYTSKNLTATGGDITLSGGRILSGAQSNIPSY